jgi:hypothetical protein
MDVYKITSLRINNTQLLDSGQYVCQVNVISKVETVFQLRVVNLTHTNDTVAPPTPGMLAWFIYSVT